MDQERDDLGRQALGLTRREQERERAHAGEETPRLTAAIDAALQAKHAEVAQMVSSLRGADEPPDLDMVSIMQRRQEELFELQAGLAQQRLKYAGYVNEFSEASLSLSLSMACPAQPIGFSRSLTPRSLLGLTRAHEHSPRDHARNQPQGRYGPASRVG